MCFTGTMCFTLHSAQLFLRLICIAEGTFQRKLSSYSEANIVPTPDKTNRWKSNTLLVIIKIQRSRSTKTIRTCCGINSPYRHGQRSLLCAAPSVHGESRSRTLGVWVWKQTFCGTTSELPPQSYPSDLPPQSYPSELPLIVWWSSMLAALKWLTELGILKGNENHTELEAVRQIGKTGLISLHFRVLFKKNIERDDTVIDPTFQIKQ